MSDEETGGCFECYAPAEECAINIAMDLANARSGPAVELVPTFTTHNRRICLLLASGEMGRLRIEDAERLQVPTLRNFLLQPECHPDEELVLFLVACLSQIYSRYELSR